MYGPLVKIRVSRTHNDFQGGGMGWGGGGEGDVVLMVCRASVNIQLGFPVE